MWEMREKTLSLSSGNLSRKIVVVSSGITVPCVQYAQIFAGAQSATTSKLTTSQLISTLSLSLPRWCRPLFTPETDRHLKYSSSRFDPVLFGDSLIGVAVALLAHFEHHAAQPAAAAGNRAHHRIAPTTAAAPAY